MCTCRACYLLFTAEDAELRYRAVPDRYLSFPDFALAPGQWDDLEIPVGLAFFFLNSVLGRTVGFYPGPAGRRPSPSCRWAPGSRSSRPTRLRAAAARRRGADRAASPTRDAPARRCFLVPIDALLRAGRPAAPGLARVRRRAGGPGADRRISSRRSPRAPAPLRRSRRGREADVTELRFTVLDIAAEPYAVAPNLLARLRIEETTGEPVHALALRAQVRIEPQRRGYDDDEEAGLLDLFGRRERWADTLKPFLWMHTAAMVPGLHRRHRGRPAAAVHLRLRGDRARSTCRRCATARSRWCCCSAAPCSPAAPPASPSTQIPWDAEATYRLPVAVWRDVMDRYFPGSQWLRLDRDTVDGARALQVGARLHQLGRHPRHRCWRRPR